MDGTALSPAASRVTVLLTPVRGGLEADVTETDPAADAGVGADGRTPDAPIGLTWQRVQVNRRPAIYAVAGDGPPVVFMHGWALAHRAYRRVLQQLVDQHMRVYAPALPGFGGTAELPNRERSLRGYARWVRKFLDAVGVEAQVTLIGHSFGGGVAIQTAHDCPDRVARLVIVNSIGGSAWSHRGGIARSLRERPLWDWGLHLQSDVMSVRQLTRVLPVIVGDAVPNLLRNPRAIWRVAHIARTADLTAELDELKRRRLPVVILWGESDTVIPDASLQSLRAALGDPQFITVPGNHSWLLADPDRFGEVITNVIGAAPTASSIRGTGRTPARPSKRSTRSRARRTKARANAEDGPNGGVEERGTL